MQLEQAGFRISRALISPIPKFAFLLAAFLVLVVLAINSFLMLSTKPNIKFSSCL